MRNEMRNVSDPFGLAEGGMKRISILSRLAGIVVVLVLAVAIYGYRQFQDWQVSPQVNPASNKVIAISGDFPYSQGLDLAFQAAFYSNNPDCREEPRVFFATPQHSAIDMRTTYSLSVRRGPGDRYTAELNLDHFTPGYCDWQYRGMSYQFLGGKLSRPGLSHALGQFPVHGQRISYRCGYSKFSNQNDAVVHCTDLPPDYLPSNISSGKNVELNFIWKGN